MKDTKFRTFDQQIRFFYTFYQDQRVYKNKINNKQTEN